MRFMVNSNILVVKTKNYGEQNVNSKCSPPKLISTTPYFLYIFHYIIVKNTSTHLSFKSAAVLY